MYVIKTEKYREERELVVHRIPPCEYLDVMQKRAKVKNFIEELELVHKKIPATNSHEKAKQIYIDMVKIEIKHGHDIFKTLREVVQWL